MKVFEKLNQIIVSIYGTAAWIMVAVMTLSITIQVFYRYILNIGLLWTEETARFLCIWLSMLGSAILIYEDDHIKVSMLEDVFPKFRPVLHLLQRLITLVYSGFMLHLGISCLNLAAAKAASPAMGWPMILVYIVYPIFGAAATLHSIYILLHWKEPKNKPNRVEGETA